MQEASREDLKDSCSDALDSYGDDETTKSLSRKSTTGSTTAGADWDDGLTFIAKGTSEYQNE